MLLKLKTGQLLRPYHRSPILGRTRRTTRTSRTPRSRSLTLSLWGTGTSPRLSLLWRIEPKIYFSHISFNFLFHLQVQQKQEQEITKIILLPCCIFWPEYFPHSEIVVNSLDGQTQGAEIVDYCACSPALQLHRQSWIHCWEPKNHKVKNHQYE